MALDDLTLVSGTANDEQDLINKLDTFLTVTLSGWSLVDTITDTSSDNDKVYTSLGSIPGRYETSTFRARGTSNYVTVHTYSSWNASLSSGEDEIVNTTESRIYSGTASVDYWLMGNSDVVHIITAPNDGNFYHAGFGTLDTYYNEAEDPRPVFIFGQNGATDTFENTNRLYAYGPFSWGNSSKINQPGSTYSGTSLAYIASHTTELTTNAASQSRTGQPYIFEPVFYHSATTTRAEVRGEVPGLFMIDPAAYSHGNVVTISGSINGDFFIHKVSSSVAWAIGKVTAV